MILTKSQYEPLKSIIGTYVGYTYDDDMVWSNWCKIEGIDLHVDTTGEFDKVQVYLRDTNGKVLGPQDIRNVHIPETILSMHNDLVTRLRASQNLAFQPEYENIIFNEQRKLYFLLTNYPGSDYPDLAKRATDVFVPKV